MLFTIKRNVTLPDGNETTVNIIIGANSPLNQDTYFSAEQLISDAALLDSYAAIGDIKIAVLSDNSVIYPLLDTVYNAGEVTDVTQVMTLIATNLQKLNTAALTSAQNKVIVSKLTQLGFPQDLAVGVVYYCQNFIQYEKVGDVTGPLNFGPKYFDNRFFVRTQAFLDEINSAYVWPFKTIQVADNKTNFQESCTDTLFLEFPNRNNMLEETAKLSSYLPKLSELCAPYKMYEIPDISEYKTNPRFPEHAYPLVEGVSSNNTHELYDNETTYYNAIIEWVQFNMKRSTVGDIDVSPENPNIDSLSQGYLEEVCKLLYSKHWYHNLNIPVYSALSEDEDDLTDLLDDSSSSSDAVVSDYVFRATEEEKRAASSGIKEMAINKSTRINALEKLIEFLREASLTVGFKAYAQAIIQLARWGERKPTCIVIKGHAWMFSLGDNKLKPYLGNMQNYALEMIDGCSSEANGALYDNTELKCKKFLMEHNYPYKNIIAPVGLITTKTLRNKASDGPREIRSCLVYSIIDIVNGYVAGDAKMKIAGITYDGNTFSASENIIMDTATTYKKIRETIKEEDNLEAPFKASQDFSDLVLDLDIRVDKVLTHFDILDSCAIQEDLDHFIETHKFTSREDLDAKIRNAKIRSKRSAFNYAYGAKLLPIYVKVSLRLNEIASTDKTITFTDVLNTYKEVLATNTLDIFDGIVEPAATVTATATTSNTQQMNLFGDATPTASATVDTVSGNGTETFSNNTVQVAADRFSFIHTPAADAGYMKLLDNAGNLIGGARTEVRTIKDPRGDMKAIKVYTLITSDALKSIDLSEVTTSMEISSLLYRLMFNLYAYEIAHEEQIVLYFDSLNTMKDYTRLINQLGKERRL